MAKLNIIKSKALLNKVSPEDLWLSKMNAKHLL